MKKLVIMVVSGFFLLTGITVSFGYKGEPGPRIEPGPDLRPPFGAWIYYRNWPLCKKIQLERFKIIEKYLPKKIQCVENANSFVEMRECIYDVNHEEGKELRKLLDKYRKIGVESLTNNK